MEAIFGKLLILGLVAGVYSRPQDTSEIDGFMLVPDDRCPASGLHRLLPHEYDCTKFYYCEYGQRHVLPRDCAPGTEFCFDAEVCIHASMANCPLPGSPTTPEATTPVSTTTTTTSTTTPAPTTTTTTTLAPTTTTTTTPAPTTTTTTTLAPTTTTTTTPAPTTTTTTTLAPTTTTTTTPAPTTTTTTTPAPTTTTTTTEVTTPCEDDCPPCPICPTTTTQAPTTTTQAPSTTTTPAPTTTGAPCTECPPCSEVTTSAPTSPTTWVPTTINPGVTLPNGCPADFDTHYLLPHETECGLYYQCVFGEVVERPCAPGTHFVYELQGCDHIAFTNCTLPGTSEAPTSSSTTTTTWAPTTTLPGVTLPNGCPASFEVHHLLPHETECDLYYQCVFGEKVVRPCAPGTHFVFELQGCDHIAFANCTLIGTSSTSAPSTQTPCPECQPSSTTTTQSPGPCPECPPCEECDSTTTSTTQASTTTTTEAPCPECPPCPEETTTTTTTTTPEPITTTTTTTTTTSTPPPVTDPCQTECHVPHWAHETDCDKFWRCDGNQKVLGICSEGLLFNSDTLTCDFICNVSCERIVVQSTAQKDGLKIFMPWEKVDDLIKLTKRHEIPIMGLSDLL